MVSLLLGGDGLADAALGELALEGGDQLTPVLDGVLQRVEAADQEGRDPEVVVVEERVSDLVRRADERGRVALRARRGGDGGVEALVEARALGRGREQAPRALVRRRSR